MITIKQPIILSASTSSLKNIIPTATAKRSLVYLKGEMIAISPPLVAKIREKYANGVKNPSNTIKGV